MNAHSILSFLEALSRNNNRDWFLNHKAEYLKLREDFELTVASLITKISTFDEEIIGVLPKECIFRINRDIRFSKDKTPYKTHFSAYIAKGGRKSLRAGYYIHIEPRGGSLVSGGIYCPEPALLKKLRKSVYENIDEFKEIVETPFFKDVFGNLSGDSLKNIPRGFPVDFQDAAYLKFKHYMVMKSLPDNFFNRQDAENCIVEDFKILYPFNRFLNYGIDE